MVPRGGAVLYPTSALTPPPSAGPSPQGPGSSLASRVAPPPSRSPAPFRSPAPSPACCSRGPHCSQPRPLSPPSAVPLAHVEMGVRGTRPPLVLLHGLFGSHGNFQTVAKALVRRVGGQVRPRGAAAEPPFHGQSRRCGGREQRPAPGDAVPPGWAGADDGRTQPRQQPPQPADDV